jgi:hypothetical protein
MVIGTVAMVGDAAVLMCVSRTLGTHKVSHDRNERTDLIKRIANGRTSNDRPKNQFAGFSAAIPNEPWPRLLAKAQWKRYRFVPECGEASAIVMSVQQQIPSRGSVAP